MLLTFYFITGFPGSSLFATSILHSFDFFSFLSLLQSLKRDKKETKTKVKCTKNKEARNRTLLHLIL